MTKFFLLIGLPGSGKSTFAKQLLAECPQMSLISTDVIRGQLFGSQTLQGPWLLIWREVERQFQQAISTANAALFDATNAQRRNRRKVIAFARELGFTQITAIWVDTPVWLCLARNKRRSRQVPEEIILRMHRQLRDAPPSLEEGLDKLIRLSEKSEYGNCARTLSENHT
ncbi:MAG: AAA family ATPase [Nostoc sp. DedVER02]|uniref:AAA family ATPase n=1 Tax=unclassified Nostoc TaxID=2593658 RepID=UPI002AD4546B|nr:MULTISPECIES: AAA family ATPase [unclassified Nostoc]MDZ7984458.1 AAA family ATPase [Nostoc sp. DedVER02]MDZ8115595.1 AAA family ATPase [Nostoc sp. DedVER01b]